MVDPLLLSVFLAEPDDEPDPDADPVDEPLLVCVGESVVDCGFELPVAVTWIPDCVGVADAESLDCQHASAD